jgi:hypothetical protein
MRCPMFELSSDSNMGTSTSMNVKAWFLFAAVVAVSATAALFLIFK